MPGRGLHRQRARADPYRHHALDHHRPADPACWRGCRLNRGLLASLLAATACAPAIGGGARPSQRLLHHIIPAPASLRLLPGDSFVIDASTTVVVSGEATTEVEGIARALAETVGAQKVPASPEGRVIGAGRGGTITLALDPAQGPLGPPEGYELAIAPDRVTLTAGQPAGLFYGVQTLRQLLPAAVEHRAALSRSLAMPVGRIVDLPRFTWRGAMLAVAR
ncbi:MAG: glycoside hydrolase family 20 zincin-like fold domain-containing protein, partial [Gemmatimonadales bacterium]